MISRAYFHIRSDADGFGGIPEKSFSKQFYEYPAEYPVLWTGMNAERGQGGCNSPPCLSQMPRLVGGMIHYGVPIGYAQRSSSTSLSPEGWVASVAGLRPGPGLLSPGPGSRKKEIRSCFLPERRKTGLLIVLSIRSAVSVIHKSAVNRGSASVSVISISPDVSGPLASWHVRKHCPR